MVRLNTGLYSRLYYRQLSINQGKSLINKSNMKQSILVENNIKILTDNIERRIEIEDKLNNIIEQRYRNHVAKQERDKERTEWGMDDFFKS